VTVAELIARLSQLPPDAEVVVERTMFTGSSVATTELVFHRGVAAPWPSSNEGGRLFHPLSLTQDGKVNGWCEAVFISAPR